jgi:hypothetical protein
MNYFETRLEFETDVSDVHAALDRIVLVDTRGDEAWAQGHVPGALHLPWAETASRGARRAGGGPAGGAPGRGAPRRGRCDLLLGARL